MARLFLFFELKIINLWRQIRRLLYCGDLYRRLGESRDKRDLTPHLSYADLLIIIGQNTLLIFPHSPII